MAYLKFIYDEESIWDHFHDLCEKVGVECKQHAARALAAAQTGNWVVAHSEWRGCKDVIVGSESLLDTNPVLWLVGCDQESPFRQFDSDSSLWFLGFHALVWANLCAFHSMNFGLAFIAAIIADWARFEIQNVPEVLDFESYLLPTLLKVMYLWASTSDCEEVPLHPQVLVFLINTLGHPIDLVSDLEVRTLKEECKEYVINRFEFVIWDIQRHYSHSSNREECLRWAREGSKFYNKRYPGKLDHESKYCEAVILMSSMCLEEASKIFAEIRNDLDSKPWETEGGDVHPATLNGGPNFAHSVNRSLYICYEEMALSHGRKFEDKKLSYELAQQEKVENAGPHEWDLDGLCCSTIIKKFRADVWEHTVNNKFEEAEACYQMFFETYPGSSFTKTHAASDIAYDVHTYVKEKYRQSYESGSPDESLFSNAKSWAMKLLESNHYSVHAVIHYQAVPFMKLVELYYEKDRQVMFLKQSSNISPLVIVKESAPILQYGKKFVECHVNALMQHPKQNEHWIFEQDLYKHLYYLLQFHNFALWIASCGCFLDSTCHITLEGRLAQLWNQSLMVEGASVESSVWQEVWKQSLLWAERQRAKSTNILLAQKTLSASVLKQLGEFDLNDNLAWNTLKSSRAACGPGTVILEYYFSEGNKLQFVYVMTKEDEVFMQILKHGYSSLLGSMLERLRPVLSQWAKSAEYERKAMNGGLEWMYEMLISPVANFLDDMKQEDKLIIVAPEILSNVPFAALRKPNSPVGEGYLIQSHTLSVTPSLRMLQHCNQRLKELNQVAPLDTKPGTIVAVGDPAYEKPGKKHGKAIEDAKKFPRRLKESGEEVNFIEELFGKEHVKKLVGPEATPSEVLKWAKYPSENGVKQVVFHIAAHGIGQDNRRKVKKGAIVLARPASSCPQNYDTAGQGAITRAQDDENFDYDNVEDETELGALSFSMVDVKEEAQISSQGEVGMTRTDTVPISESAPDLLKSENISGCGFPWEAHMVVLSACDTARGQITGEGVLNLPRALMIAGVPCVVVSQWEVGDEATCKLMKGFYQELRSGKDVSSCLRTAMLKMIKDEGKVHEWAPFFVCGLPTVCLPTELQAVTSSCKGDDPGTSSDTKAERRFKDVKVKPLDLDVDPEQRLIDLGFQYK